MSVELVPWTGPPRGVFPESALKRQFSEAFCRTMAAVLNVRCTVYESGEDIDSVDIEFDSGRFGPNRVRLGINRKLEVQLKCTVRTELKRMEHPDTGVPCQRYYLAVKDYERLAVDEDSRAYPHVLVVLLVPPDPALWLVHHGPLTILRAKAWWLDLTGGPAPVNQHREPVYIPTVQVFDTSALNSLMQGPR